MFNKRVLSILSFVSLTVVFVLLAWVFSNIFSYFIIALVLSAILSPLTDYIYRFQLYGLHTPRFLAVILSFVVTAVVITLFVTLFIPLVKNQVTLITTIDYEELYDRASLPLQRMEGFLINNRIVDQTGFLVDNLRRSLLTLLEKVDFEDVINLLISITGNVFVGVIAVSFITFVLLYEKGIVRRQVIKLIPNQYFEVFIAAIYKIETLLSNYLIGLLFQIFSIFCVAALGLSLMGVEYALTIAIFAAVANLIPYAGPLLGSAFGVVVGLSSAALDANDNETAFLIVKIISVFAVVQLVDNLFLQPLIFSKSIKAHPLEIFVAIFAGATVAGVLGMIAAIPVYTILRVVTTELYAGYKQYHVFKVN